MGASLYIKLVGSCFSKALKSFSKWIRGVHILTPSTQSGNERPHKQIMQGGQVLQTSYACLAQIPFIQICRIQEIFLMLKFHFVLFLAQLFGTF